MDQAAILPARHRLDVEAYHRMGEAGIFGENDRIELLDGELIDMAPIGQDHASIVNRLNRALVLSLLDRAIVSPQNSVRLDRLSEPQPDFAVLRPRDDFYAKGEPPGPADILLLVEVSDSSLRFDKTVKLPLYARAGIAELWIIDVKRGVVDVYRKPNGDSYGEQITQRPGDRIALALAPDIIVTLDIM